MNDLITFFNRMDARAMRALLVSLGLFALVAAIFLAGRFVLGVELGELETWFGQASREWYALPLTILVFVALSFLGAPQFALQAAAVLAFGPVDGFVNAWVASMVAAVIHFWLGRWMGADIVARYGGRTVNRISTFVGRNAFWSSAIIRNVPSAPFIVINLAAGASKMGFIGYFLGTGLGIVPKIALVAFAGGSLIALFGGAGPWMAAILALSALGWLGGMLLARRWFARPAAQAPADDPSSGAGRLAIGDAPSHKE
jgi:uncharacterized membrane protein YdjX (TVP38/TMEM64 family)